MKLDLSEIADRALREAFRRHNDVMAETINRLADESGVIVNGVRYVNVVRALEVLIVTGAEEI